MNQGIIISATEVSFKDFLFKDKRNRTILWIAGTAILIQFAIFKYLYPFASYIHGDSFSYLTAAYHNLTINTYPIGYSKFLRLVSIFVKSDFVLAALQYLFIQASVLYLLFTLFYFYRAGKVIQYILLIIMVCNPLFLHLANLVSSDNFFLSLSMIWFTLLLWIIHKPSTQLIILHALVLFIAFTVRYNALLYPILSILAFLISKISLRQKLVGITASTALCGLFVSFTSYRYKRLTGHWQYSPFSGWQMANNAMYAYRYVDSSKRKPVSQKFRLLDNMVRAYFDSHRDTTKYPTESAMASTYYMWSKGMPLMDYRDELFKKDSTATELKKWASVAPFYKEYGIEIINLYPDKFLQYFIWPNANKYYAPPIEFLETYNWGKDSVPFLAQAWFGYKNGKVSIRMKDKRTWVLDYYPILSGVLNVVMLCCIVCYFMLNGWKINELFKYGLLIGGIFWLLNALFTIGASSAALRFQSFPLTLTTIFVLLLIDWMVQLMRKMEAEKKLTPASMLTAEIKTEVVV